MWNSFKDIMLAFFIVFCLIGVIGGLSWLIVNSDNKQMEKDRQFFLECYKKTNDIEWCYDL